MGTSTSAISFGLAATAILISMFLVMAIFEHLIKPRASFLRSRNDAHGSSELRRPQAQIHRSQEKVQNSTTVGTRCASDLSVLMPGQRFPTYIAQPAPLPCPREGITWPSHVAPVSYMYDKLISFATVICLQRRRLLTVMPAGPPLPFLRFPHTDVYLLLNPPKLRTAPSSPPLFHLKLLACQISQGFVTTSKQDSMMNGYRKMTVSNRFITKSSSIDFSDLTFYPEPKESHEHPYPTSVAQEKDADVEIHDQYFTWQEVEAAQPGSGLALSRSCSSASRRFRASGKTVLETMVRKAFTTRKPSSVAAGGYWRIHDTDGGDGEGEFVEEQQLRSPRRKKKKKGGNILRACKQIFGF
ncbi:hypothetical protein OPV22_034998 [Ensete ventricosum]|uniref:Uncharacterized protein n=1 Tax=Ensete ventricosum TaxID=4639 RepID=A0AAV8PLT2_ENSVE|nr:hypothetical protein OPV22_034998 [Ensete ventricosum]